MLTHIGTNTFETERLLLYRWAIVLKETGECIGSAFQCKGYATEATKAIIRFSFERMNLHKVQICTKEINIPSKRVIEKCGFIYEGMLRDYFYMNGEYVGRLYFSILQSEQKSKMP
ncbi:MAG: GNAT family N-acetyltransferase [Lachnospiraceae bacterium]|nr:GNAT family N-acetyltransferase [Lachnospiraceae bacterium]